MKHLATLLFTFLIVSYASAQVNPNNHYVQGHYNSDGTYTQGHYQTDPNVTNRDNYSTYPNTNPYTGQQGTVKPDNNYSYPSYSSPSYNSYPSYNSTPSYDNSKTIYTGPKGGQYYINNNGNKVYVKPD